MSRKIAVVTDSNSGITQKMAEEMGVYVLPMPFVVNEKVYFEDISLTQPEFYGLLAQDADISTSQPAIGDVLELWDKLLKTYDAVVHIPMSAGLSASCGTAIGLADDYGGRVQVVNNLRISVTQRQAVEDALTLVNAGKSAAEIREILEETKLEASIYIMMDTLKYLKKGGRITPAAAAIGTVLGIRPVLQVQGDKLDAFKKVRGDKAGKRVMLEAMKADIEQRFGGVENVELYVAYTNIPEEAAAFAKAAGEALGTRVRFCDPLSLSVSCHIGPGALAIGCAAKIDKYL